MKRKRAKTKDPEMTQFFASIMKVVRSAERGRRMMFANGPFIYVACKDGNCWDTWVLEPYSSQALCISLERKFDWPTSLWVEKGSIKLQWDGCYEWQGIEEVETGAEYWHLDVTLYGIDRKMCLSNDKKWIERFNELEAEVIKKYHPPRRKKAKQ